MALLHPSTMPAPIAFDARRFFAETVPQALRARADVARAAGGRAAFEVRGAGAWTIDLGRGVVEAGADDAAVRVVVDAALLGEVIAGKCTPDDARARGLQVIGDATVLAAVAVVLDP